MAATRPQCPQCSAPSPSVVEFGLFALPDAAVEQHLAAGWGDTSNFVWQCQGCKFEWGV